MSFSITKAFFFLGILTVLLFHVNAQTSVSVPKLVLLATGTIDIGKPLSPIPIPGGVRVVEPLAGGTLNGPTFNATIFGGIAYPAVYNNQTIQVPQIRLYGNTSDGVPFLIEESGVGNPNSQFTRIQLEIGGKYAALSNAFILASVLPSKDRTQVIIRSFQVV